MASLTLLVGLIGERHVVAQDGAIVGWGEQFVVPQHALTDLVAVAPGEHHSLALKADGSIVAWGSNDGGQCHVPAPNSGFIAVAGGGYHSLSLKSDGSIAAWGDNPCGLGNVDLDDNVGKTADYMPHWVSTTGGTGPRSETPTVRIGAQSNGARSRNLMRRNDRANAEC